jgi:protease I
MKAIFLAADGFEDTELLVPYYRMLEEGFDVVVAAPQGRDIEGKHGYSVSVDRDLTGLGADEYDMLVLPGGSGPEKVRLHDDAVELARRMMQQHKPVASICHGVQTLISADVLKDRKATCWPGVKDDLKAAGAQFVDEPVVIDENLITSRHPGDLPQFCKAMMDAAHAHAG